MLGTSRGHVCPTVFTVNTVSLWSAFVLSNVLIFCSSLQHQNFYFIFWPQLVLFSPLYLHSPDPCYYLLTGDFIYPFDCCGGQFSYYLGHCLLSFSLYSHSFAFILRKPIHSLVFCSVLLLFYNIEITKNVSLY